ncbi:SDR family oxidoreductase [Hazenella sp. IB182353]|uniref:SDR family NAD(P)-dependent oxidoreductase n=1 Tax=Polycladospora coralii TaxID=2771432 RepID=UPI0017472429|nr:SDR family oxidoreductase [Polycladospora coralii]MBS7529757.1 SDR family oxidoreductase [Polycladospora coralii]
MRKTALITGATTGIGYELAKFFAMNDNDLILVARDRGKLSQIASEWRLEYKVCVDIIAVDLRDSQAPQVIMEKCADKEIDILVNNAGMGVYGNFTTNKLEDELSLIQVNISALTHLTKEISKQMIKRRQGKILNVAAASAFIPRSVMAVYDASKAYVVAFSEALAHELSKDHITVSVLCPGPTQTEFDRKANIGNHSQTKMTAEEVAKIAYRGLVENKRIIIPGTQNRLRTGTVSILPRKVIANISRKMQISSKRK